MFAQKNRQLLKQSAICVLFRPVNFNQHFYVIEASFSLFLFIYVILSLQVGIEKTFLQTDQRSVLLLLA